MVDLLLCFGCCLPDVSLIFGCYLFGGVYLLACCRFWLFWWFGGLDLLGFGCFVWFANWFWIELACCFVCCVCEFCLLGL